MRQCISAERLVKVSRFESPDDMAAVMSAIGSMSGLVVYTTFKGLARAPILHCTNISWGKFRVTVVLIPDLLVQWFDLYCFSVAELGV